MITKLNLKNFKCFVDCELNFTPLTILTGMNSSGKSSVIQAIRMIYQYYKFPVPIPTPFLQDHVLPNALKSKLSKEDFFLLKAIISNIDYKLEVNKISKESFQVVPQDAKLIETINYLSASRLGPQNALPVGNLSVLTSVDDKGKYAISFLEKNAYSKVPEQMRIKVESDTLKINVDDWREIITPRTRLTYTINLTQNTAYPYYNNIMPTETGFGLSYTLPLIISLLYIDSENPNAILLLENPEAHLHPAAQTKLGELIASVAATGKQIIVETHSDHIIDGMRIAAKQKKIENTNVTFHYFSKPSFEDKAKVETPILYENGKLSFWPNGFFDQGIINKAELIKK